MDYGVELMLVATDAREGEYETDTSYRGKLNTWKKIMLDEQGDTVMMKWERL